MRDRSACVYTANGDAEGHVIVAKVASEQPHEATSGTAWFPALQTLV